jgi:hypothetical protein
MGIIWREMQRLLCNTVHCLSKRHKNNSTSPPSDMKEFFEQQNLITDLYDIKRLEAKRDSIKHLGDDLIQPSTLSGLTIQYVVYEGSEKIEAKNESQIRRMQLLAGYLQGLNVARDLILEGNYIKASAVLKQDYEIIVRLNAIVKNMDKPGRAPNPQSLPPEARKIDGYVNNIAHISKIEILEKLLHHKDHNAQEGFAPVKKMRVEYLDEMFTYESFVRLEVLRHAFLLHYELAGEDEIYSKALSHYKKIVAVYGKHPKLEVSLSA